MSELVVETGTRSAGMLPQPTVTIDAPGVRDVRLTGTPAVLVILAVFAIVIAFLTRFWIVRRGARAAHNRLRVSEAEQRSLFAAMDEVVLVIGGDGVLKRVPITSARPLRGVTSAMTGRNVLELLGPEVGARMREFAARAIDGAAPVTAELQLPTDEGTSVWFAVTVTAIDVDSALWVARDITDQKQARDELAQSEVEYRLLFDHNPCALWVYDVATTAILDVNAAAVATYGYSREEFRRMTLADLRCSEQVESLRAMLGAMDPMLPRLDIARHCTKDGRQLDVEVRGRPLGHEQPIRRLVVATDITDRLRAEARARSTGEMLQSVINAAPQAILSTDRSWNVTRWNRAAELLFGWQASEVLGRPAPCVPEAQRAQIQTMAALADQVDGGRTIELECVCKDGTHVYTLLGIAGLHDVGDAPIGFVAVFTDITERIIRDEQQRQSQKMEAVGRLAGGIAHDFNNILTVISSYSRMLLDSVHEVEAREDLGEIALAADRATALTRQLLAFSRRDVVSSRAVSLTEIAKGMETMLQRLLNADITFVWRLRADVDLVVADPTQIEQIVMNLVVNASDAMPHGGTLVVETDNTSLDAAYARAHSDVIPGDYVMLAVTDTGKGMDTATMSKAFEPFFTTKDVGRGTGLGLATVYAIVNQLHGHVWVYSEVDQGTTFKVYLPKVVADATVPEPDVPALLLPETAAGTVLLVEDDVAVRRVVRRMLEAMQYKVIEASDGEDGLEVASVHGQSIDVVLTDLMMPKMNGRELANALAVSNPQLRVLFTSGYTDDAVIRRGLMESAHAFLQKPFTTEQLARTLSELRR